MAAELMAFLDRLQLALSLMWCVGVAVLLPSIAVYELVRFLRGRP